MNRKGLKMAAAQCTADAKGPVKKVSLLYVIVMVVILCVDIATTFLSNSTSATSHISDSLSLTVSTYVTVYGLSLVLQALMVLLEAGYTVFALALSRNEEFDWKVLLSGTRDWLRVICFYILRSIYMALWSFAFAIPMGLVISPLMLAGMDGMLPQALPAAILVLLSIALSVFISLRYWGGFFVLMDHPEMTSTQALNHTRDLCKHHRWELFKLELSFVPTLLLCTITVGILLIWKLPYIMATYAHAYHYLTMAYNQRSSFYQQQFHTPE